MPNDIKKLSRLMSEANYLRKNPPVILRGATYDKKGALKNAWYFEDLRDQFRTGSYRFSYFKKDGSIREAVGTLNPALIPEDKMPKSGMDPDAVAPVETFRYYDLSVHGWRSFCIDLFIGFVEKV